MEYTSSMEQYERVYALESMKSLTLRLEGADR